MGSFGDRVRTGRIAVGLTQEQLGFACGVSKQSVSDWENGRQFPNFQAWPHLRTALQRSLDDLICGDSAPAVSSRAAGRVGESETPAYSQGLTEVTAVRDRKELAMLLRYRSISAKRQAAWLELMKP